MAAVVDDHLPRSRDRPLETVGAGRIRKLVVLTPDDQRRRFDGPHPLFGEAPAIACLLHLADRIRRSQPHRQLFVDHLIGDELLVMEEDAEKLARFLTRHAVLNLTPMRGLGRQRRRRPVACGTKSTAISEHDPVDGVRKPRGRIQRDARAHRVADEGRLRHVHRLQESDEEFGEHSGVIVRERLVRLAETDLIEREHVKVFRERIDVVFPSRAVTAEAVKEHDWRAAAGFEIVKLEGQHRDVFRQGRRFFLRHGDRNARAESGNHEHSRQHGGDSSSGAGGSVASFFMRCECSDSPPSPPSQSLRRVAFSRRR